MNENEQEFLVQKIRTQYTEKEYTQLDTLKALDAKEKRPANISAIIMGSGMSLVMTEIGKTIGIANPMVPGVVIGVVGMAMAIMNYPIYKNILRSRRKKYADEMIRLTDELLK